MKHFRTFLELISRGVVLKRKIKVNNQSLPIFITPDAQLKYLKIGKSAFDSDLISIAEKFLHKTSNVWDIGGNVGIFTFASSEIASEGKILCIEADIWLASVIMKTKRLKFYKEKDISVLPAAVSNKTSVAQFLIASRGRASNALYEAKGRSQMGGVREVQYVPTIKLDMLPEVFGNPDFVKIDVEGAELMVVKGATDIISKIRPFFYIEIGQNVSKDIFEIFSYNNYRASNYKGGKITHGSYANVLFIPEEKWREDLF